MTPETKAQALKSMRERASELRDKVHAHLNGDALRALEDWKETAKREAKEAAIELIELEKAIAEMEKL